MIRAALQRVGVFLLFITDGSSGSQGVV